MFTQLRKEFLRVWSVVNNWYLQQSLKGVTAIPDEELRQNAIQVSRLGLIIATILFLIAPIFHFYLLPEPIITFGILNYAALNILAVQLNRGGFHAVAAWLLYITQCAAILYFGHVIGPVIQLQFMVFFLVAINFLIFKEKIARRFSFLISLGILADLQFAYHYASPVIELQVPEAAIITVQLIAILNVMMIVLLITNLWHKSMHLNDELARNNKVIKMFVAQITHEIRSPLNAISVIAEMLKQEVKKDPHLKKIEKHADMLILGSNTTRTIVNNVLDMAEIEAGKQETGMEQTFFVRSFFDKLIDMSMVIARSRKMKIRLYIEHMPSLITSDPLKLNQIMNNLLSNAIKYGNKHSTITVTIRKKDEDKWTIEVKNPSEPIAVEKLNSIFDPFMTSKSHITEGTGLGLFIVKNKVTSMKGQISADSTSDHHAVFTITLPLQVGRIKDLELEEDDDEPVDDVSNTRILIAEDEPINARVLSMYLSEMGCQTQIAKNGKEMLAKAREQKPDIIMMDYQMPLMNGEVAMHHLKADPLLKDIPVIVTTGEIFTNSLDRMLEAGADAFITKPIDPKPLRQVLAKNMVQRRNVLR